MHPRHVLDDEDLALVDLWAAYRRDGMGGVGYLPFAGGYADQPSALMRALDAMNTADARIREKMKPPG